MIDKNVDENKWLKNKNFSLQLTLAISLPNVLILMLKKVDNLCAHCHTLFNLLGFLNLSLKRASALITFCS